MPLRSLLRRLRSKPSSRPATVSPPKPKPRAWQAPAPSAPSPDRDRELLLYGYDACPYCQKVFRAVTRLELDVPRADTRLDPDAASTLRGLTGGTQVPCLVIDGEALLESDDIVAWLEAYAAR